MLNTSSIITLSTNFYCEVAVNARIWAAGAKFRWPADGRPTFCWLYLGLVAFRAFHRVAWTSSV